MCVQGSADVGSCQKVKYRNHGRRGKLENCIDWPSPRPVTGLYMSYDDDDDELDDSRDL